MAELFVLIAHLLKTLTTLLRPGGVTVVMAESLAIKQQLQVVRRSQKRAPRLTCWDRLVFGLCAFFISAKRLRKCAVIIQPSTFLRLHQWLVKCKYRWLNSSKKRKKPGPKGPSAELIRAVLEMKQRNPRMGCRKIAEQLSRAFGIEINKDVVRRILAKHPLPGKGGQGPSWLTALAHAKDSLWSIDLFRCESIVLQSVWVMVVLDVFSREVIGFSVQRGDVDGPAVCRMFHEARVGHKLPSHISTDHDPLFRFHRWRANLRILEVEEIKSVPNIPWSHPFVERVIGTIRRELLDQILFWNGVDLSRKLEAFRVYYNHHRCHTGLNGATPMSMAGVRGNASASFQSYRWETHCSGLFHLPVAT